MEVTVVKVLINTRWADGKGGSRAAYSLLITLVVVGVIMVLFAGAAKWSSTSVTLDDRNNTYVRTVSAAEAATEQALSCLARDFFNQTFDPSTLGAYRREVPATEWAASYAFSDGNGGAGQTAVESGSLTLITNLNSQYRGLFGMGYECRVRSQAKPLGTPYDLGAVVQQDIQLAAIPLFQFAIFYSMDLEINPGPQMQITGKVHSNGSLFTAPGTGLEYADVVTAAGQVLQQRHPLDPLTPSGIKPTFSRGYLEKVSALTLPVGTNNSPEQVRRILEVPPYSENAASPMGRERYYNKVDLIVTTTALGTAVIAGNWGSWQPLSPDEAVATNKTGYSFVRTNATFWDARENKWTVTTDIDVTSFGLWMTNGGAPLNSLAMSRLGHQINSIYVDDQRSGAGLLTVVRLSNGRYLPASGLTVATRHPLYIQGHFNAPGITPGSRDTSATRPASLLGDSITVLSGSWLDSNSAKSLSSRVAASTTVNAAFLAGIVETGLYGGIKRYSGGVENFPRFLEDWSGYTLTYNGSMVVMFPSQFATGFWISPGTYYQAPARSWAFDPNFLDYRKLPPVTPQVRKIIRGRWTQLAAR